MKSDIRPIAGLNAISRYWKTGLCFLACAILLPGIGESEIIRRDLGKNNKGETVTGYVFQAGRSHARRSRTSNSVFGGRPVRYHRPRGIVYGHSYPLYAPHFYYSVPHTFSYPIHRCHQVRGVLSVRVRF